MHDQNSMHGILIDLAGRPHRACASLPSDVYSLRMWRYFLTPRVEVVCVGVAQFLWCTCIISEVHNLLWSQCILYGTPSRTFEFLGYLCKFWRQCWTQPLPSKQFYVCACKYQHTIVFLQQCAAYVYTCTYTMKEVCCKVLSVKNF